MSFFEDNFPNVRLMLENERRRKNDAATNSGKDWHLMALKLGKPKVEFSYDTRDEAMEAKAELLSGCAAWVRDTIWVQGPNGERL